MYENETSSKDDDNANEVENDLQKAIAESFTSIAADGKFIEVKDLGKVIRHLGCVPSEKELKEFENSVVNDKSPGLISLNVFASHMEKQIRELRYKPGTADELLKAFRMLDVKNKGSLSIDCVRQALRKGETFDDDEIDAALKTAYDPDYDCIHYDEWINKLLGRKKLDVYALIPTSDDGDGLGEADYRDE